jgi:hypothetical protein
MSTAMPPEDESGLLTGTVVDGLKPALIAWETWLADRPCPWDRWP